MTRNPLSLDERYPHGPQGYQLRLMVTRGEMEEAQSFLDALNHSRKVFGHPLLEMPPPFEIGLPDLVTCPLVEVECLKPRKGWERRAA